MTLGTLSWLARHCSALLLLVCTVGTLAAAPAGAAPATVLVVGDSLSAEYGLKRGTGWVALLEQRLARDKRAVRVINASISGDTTAGGRARLPALLDQHRPQVVVIELGGNDALRGLPLDITRSHLEAMTQQSKARGAKVLLVGMEVPPNYGQDYTRRFAENYQAVAKAHQVRLVPFMLKGVADVPQSAQWFQADRIHPNEAAHPIIFQNIWPALKDLLP